jgi:predicted MFS family arabinose efflux permease
VSTAASESLANPRLWLAFSIMALVGGLPAVFPVFMPALLADFGGSRAAVAAWMSLFWLVGAVVGPLAGRWVDRGDPRLVVSAGLLFTAAGTAAAALAPSLTWFTIPIGVLGGVGAGLTGFVPQAAVIGETYRVRRGFATGIAFAGSMVGYALAMPAHVVIEAIGWRWSLVAWAVLLVTLVPLVLARYPCRLGERRSPAPVSSAAGDHRRAVARTTAFWALAVSFALPPFVGYLLTLHHVLYFSSRGFTAGEAAAMLFAGGILSTLGRAAVGYVADRLGGPTAAVASWMLTLAGALSLIGFETGRLPLLAYAYVLFVFPQMGSRATVVSVLVTRIAPPGRYGAVFGLLVIGNGLGAGLGPFVSGALYDLTHSYLVIFVTAASLIAVAITALFVFLRTAPAAAAA